MRIRSDLYQLSEIRFYAALWMGRKRKGPREGECAEREIRADCEAGSLGGFHAERAGEQQDWSREHDVLARKRASCGRSDGW
jgi:hypothetical protein